MAYILVRKKISIKKVFPTQQLQNEDDHKIRFKLYCEQNNYKIVKEILPHENKLYKNGTDFIINTIHGKKTVSLKTNAGLFTKANWGTGINSAWIKALPPCDTLALIKKYDAMFHIRAVELIKKGHTTYKDLTTIDKMYVLEPKYLMVLELLRKYPNIVIKTIYDWKSDYIYVDSLRIMSSCPEFKNITIDGVVTNCYTCTIVYTDTENKKYTICLRLKTASDNNKIGSAPKINVQ